MSYVEWMKQAEANGWIKDGLNRKQLLDLVTMAYFAGRQEGWDDAYNHKNFNSQDSQW